MTIESGNVELTRDHKKLSCKRKPYLSILFVYNHDNTFPYYEYHSKIKVEKNPVRTNTAAIQKSIIYYDNIMSLHAFNKNICRTFMNSFLCFSLPVEKQIQKAGRFRFADSSLQVTL